MKKIKTGGRKAGTPNKSTAEIRDFIQSFLGAKFEELDEIFDQLEPKDKINALIKLTSYAVPKQSQMEMTAIHKQELAPDLSMLTDEELHHILEINKKVYPEN